jgi:hypothetical protein
MPIIEWIPEPKFGDREKREQDDLEYNSEPKVSLEEQKEQLKNELFGSFKQEDDPLANLYIKEKFIEPEDMVDPSLSEKESDIETEYFENIDDISDTWIEEEYKEKLNDKEIKEIKEYPLVKNYLEERNIPVDNLSLDENWKIDINNIDWLSIEDKEMLNWLIINIEWDNIKQNIIDLSKTINDISEFDDYNKNITDEWFSDWVLNKIWENYIKIPDSKWEFDNIKNIWTAIELTKNEICIEAKNFNRDSQTYKTAILNIESWNLKKQLEWINSLYYLAYSTEWKLWAKNSLKSHKDKRKKELISDANVLEEKIQLALKQWDEKQLKQLDIDKDRIISEVEELVSWDVFEAWELDKITDDLNEKKEVN